MPAWTPPQAVLEECAKFNEGVVGSLNLEATRTPRAGKTASVTTTPGFKEALPAVRRGRLARSCSTRLDFGGQGLPKTIGAACVEMTQ